MNSSAIAMDYANVLFDVCEEKGIAYDVLYEMNQINSVRSSTIDKVLTLPVVDKSMQLDLINSLNELDVHKELINMMKILIDRGQFSYFPDILNAYKALLQERENIRIVEVTSAKKLTTEMINYLREQLEAKFQDFVIILNEVDPSLIGGIIIEYDGKIIDNTVKNYLKNLKNINL